MNYNKVEKHESYGMLSIGSISGKLNLFDTNIDHGGGMRLSISRAHNSRHLNRNWIHADEDLIEIYMSPIQFAEAITSGMNTTGVPCTIKHVNRVRMEEPPIIDQTAELKQEVNKELGKRVEDVREALGMLDGLLDAKGSISKTKLREVQTKLSQSVMHFESNINYTKNCLNEDIDKTVLEAKATVKHFVDSTIQQLGLEALSEKTGIALPHVQMKEIDRQ